jgi:hypothetical protein
MQSFAFIGGNAFEFAQKLRFKRIFRGQYNQAVTYFITETHILYFIAGIFNCIQSIKLFLYRP